MTWQEINRKRLPFIRMGERLFRGWYSGVKRDYIASLQNLTTPEEIIEASRNLNIDDKSLMSIYEKFYLKTGIAFAKWTVKGLRRGMETKQEDMWEDKILEYVKSNSGAKITDIIRTHHKDIERITRIAVEKGIKEGQGMIKIARAIQDAAADLDLWKAMRIARTEVGAASNLGVLVGAEDLPGNKVKVWISTFDQRARPDHMAMDGVEVALNEKFTLPSGNTLNFPCDSSGEPGDIINCRCGYEVVVSSEIY